MHCYYCGTDQERMTQEHLTPRSKGGRYGATVPACGPCNSTRGNRPFEQIRYRLVLRMIGWPRFTLEQLEWLRDQGFDMQPYDTAQLWFERDENRSHAKSCQVLPKTVSRGNINVNLIYPHPCVAELE